MQNTCIKRQLRYWCARVEVEIGEFIAVVHSVKEQTANVDCGTTANLSVEVISLDRQQSKIRLVFPRTCATCSYVPTAKMYIPTAIKVIFLAF